MASNLPQKSWPIDIKDLPYGVIQCIFRHFDLGDPSISPTALAGELHKRDLNEDTVKVAFHPDADSDTVTSYFPNSQHEEEDRLLCIQIARSAPRGITDVLAENDLLLTIDNKGNFRIGFGKHTAFKASTKIMDKARSIPVLSRVHSAVTHSLYVNMLQNIVEYICKSRLMHQ